MGELTLLVVSDLALALGIAVLVSLSISTLAGGSRLLVAQAAASAVLTVSISDGSAGPERLIDALIGATLGGEASELFDAIAAGDEVAAKKPAPDVYLLALDRLRVQADRAVALEDSLNGIAWAQDGGIACIVSPATCTQGDAFPADTPLVGSFADLGGIAGIAERLGVSA